jgi:hypothetical protein
MKADDDRGDRLDLGPARKILRHSMVLFPLTNDRNRNFEGKGGVRGLLVALILEDALHHGGRDSRDAHLAGGRQ